MRKSGVILGYRTLIDPEKVGLGVSVFISVTLEKKTRTAVDEFEIAVKKIPEITECYEISGRADYLLRVVVRDIKEYRDFLMDRLMRIAGVRDVESSFLLETVKENCGLPIRPMGLSTTGDAV
jgi:Lrp/AsnC family leucine-responsive transcriptional regulator